MRALLLVLLGLAIGAIGATFALSALRQGTPYHKAVMAVMQHHMGALREDVRANRCEAKGTAAHLGRMRQDAGDIGAAFPDMDKGFHDATDRLTASLDRALTAAPGDCAALGAALAPIGESCQSCHRQYR
ncbi:MAG: hypothetical protein GAK28_00020 [Luteibacter sp.]|uniref:cytochrome c n=1 Tax=Luteibacter sp. TaxID=1886636 RepID=UPI001382AA15|nr:cytochrome c [Luteibacter sp.]KAF1009383.1 MAG: hypothetical protein GAK28_00020 [Luteibacter sp.]